MNDKLRSIACTAWDELRGLPRRRFFALGCLVALVALFYAIEDWSGWRAWEKYKRSWVAKGERFDLGSFVPPLVPDDQNFFETPLWSDLHFGATNAIPDQGRDGPDRPQRVIFSAVGPNSYQAPSTGNWAKAQRADLAAWQSFYRGSNNSSAIDNWSATNNPMLSALLRRYRRGASTGEEPQASAERGTRTNYFPLAEQAQTPAADVLLALSKFSANRQLLIEASARPQARFWVDYDAGFAARIPHLARLKAAAQYLSLHADAALEAGDRATALEDSRLMFRLIDSTRNEPLLISHLVRVAILQIALQPVWEGLAERRWTEADLVVIDGELRSLDFLADYHFALRGERAGEVFIVDYLRREGFPALNLMGGLAPGSRPLDAEQLVGRVGFWLIPTGWFNQNKVSLCRMHDQYLLPLVVNREVRTIPPAGVRQASAALDKQRMGPYNMFSKMLLPSLARTAEKCARAQGSVDLARVACALERFRLANGEFLETLEALTPNFTEKLPHDLINGQPLKYRRTPDGQFILYSVGWNEIDDGGTVGLKQNGNPDWDQGDWVWRYPAMSAQSR